MKGSSQKSSKSLINMQETLDFGSHWGNAKEHWVWAEICSNQDNIHLLGEHAFSHT